jgi:hypothetical protein
MQTMVNQLGDLIHMERSPHSEPLQLNRANLLYEAELMVAHLLMQHSLAGHTFNNGEIQVACVVSEAFLFELF